MHDLLFTDRANLSKDSLLIDGRRLGLDMKQYSKCIESNSADRVRSDIALAKSLGVTGTPTFFAGYRVSDSSVKVVDTLAGAASIVEFRSLVEEVIKVHH